MGALRCAFRDALWENLFQERQDLPRWQRGEFVRQFGGDAGEVGETDDTIGELSGGDAEQLAGGAGGQPQAGAASGFIGCGVRGAGLRAEDQCVWAVGSTQHDRRPGMRHMCERQGCIGGGGEPSQLGDPRTQRFRRGHRCFDQVYLHGHPTHCKQLTAGYSARSRAEISYRTGWHRRHALLMIVITGATGTIGSEIVRQLAARGVRVRAVTRNPERVPAGVEVVRGDYHDPDSMAAAMTGADAAFLVGVLGPDDAETDRALVRTARAAGVRRIVKLSAIGTGDPELGRVGTWHMPGEQAARESGLEWTILRPTSFASNTLSWADAIRSGRPVPNLTGTGSQGVIDPRDVAAVAAEALLTPGHSGHIYTLTGPALLTCADQVTTLAAVLGQPLDVVDVPEDVAREHMISSGMSPEFADGALAGQAYVRAGGNATLTDDVHQVLGRAPRSYAEWAADHASFFAALADAP